MTDCFKRYELKYLLNETQYKSFVSLTENFLKPDVYFDSQVCNVYYDTDDNRLIRRSLEKPVYKEKLRLRSYGTPKIGDKVFLELKKKYDSVVYKRRESMTVENAENFLRSPEPFSQISREISYFIDFYGELTPKYYLCYNRLAFVGKTDENTRLTFDKDVLYRTENVDLKAGAYGERVIPENTVLLEIKIADGMPLWLSGALSEIKAYKTSFSKYGAAYSAELGKKQKGDLLYA